MATLPILKASRVGVINPKRLFEKTFNIVILTIILGLSVMARGAYLLEIDTDGTDDGVLTYNPRFSYGGDTTTASQSTPSTAWGTNGADSIFGGDGSAQPDTYVYTYRPTLDADNLIIPAGTNLGGGLATGAVGGLTGTYRVYATWPYSENVSGGLTRYTVSTAGDSFFVDIDQNFKGNVWILLGEIDFSNPASQITVTQEATEANSFVSMRSYALLFEATAVPEPATLSLLGLGLLLVRRKRRPR